MYQHVDINGNAIDLPVAKVICVGRNYLDHIDEMKSAVPAEPLLFMKPKAALCALDAPLVIPANLGECHNELEVAILLKSPLTNADINEVKQAIWGVGIGLDLTLRDVQASLKAQGYPWERAKSFDASAPVSGFVAWSEVTDIDDLHFTLTVNGELRQQGHTAMMMHKALALIAHMSCVFSLEAGDVILTGTPKGVGPLCAGEAIRATLSPWLDVTTKVAG